MLDVAFGQIFGPYQFFCHQIPIVNNDPALQLHVGRQKSNRLLQQNRCSDQLIATRGVFFLVFTPRQERLNRNLFSGPSGGTCIGRDKKAAVLSLFSSSRSRDARRLPLRHHHGNNNKFVGRPPGDFTRNFRRRADSA